MSTQQPFSDLDMVKPGQVARADSGYAPSIAPSVASTSSSVSAASKKSGGFGGKFAKFLGSKSSSASLADDAASSAASKPALEVKTKFEPTPAPVFVGGGRGGRGVRMTAVAKPTTGSLSSAPTFSTKPQERTLSAPVASGGGRGGRGAVKMSLTSSTTSASANGASLNAAGMPEDPEEDKVVCFPGWATITRSPSTDSLSLTIFAHGYAYRQQPLSLASGSARIFYALAKSFSALPKLPVAGASSTSHSLNGGPSLDNLASPFSPVDGERVLSSLLDIGGREGTANETIELAKTTVAAVNGTLPVTPAAVFSAEPEELASSSSSYFGASSRTSSSSSLPYLSGNSASCRPILASLTPSTLPSSSSSDEIEPWPLPFPPSSFTTSQLTQYHQNVHSRLLPFLGLKLPDRRVRVTVSSAQSGEVLLTEYVTTSAPGGGWTTEFVLSGETIAELVSSHSQEGEVEEEDPPLNLTITAELLAPEPVTYAEIPSSAPVEVSGGGRGGRAATAAAPTREVRRAPEGWEETSKVTAMDKVDVPVGGEVEKGEGVGRGEVRVVSDVDDTVKWTEVVKGTKTIFRNCFVRELKDVRVPGMASWYRHLSAHHSAHFHYVSNSPWELYPVIRSFLKVAGFPSGSVTLKEYGGAASTLAKLWEEPGARKRANVERVLKEFPESKFILVGDSGEQDMQLYCSLAGQYPHQVLAIYIRDVTTPFTPPSSSTPASDLSRWTSHSSDVASFVLTEEPEEEDEYLASCDREDLAAATAGLDLPSIAPSPTSSSGSSIKSGRSLLSLSSPLSSTTTSPPILSRTTTVDSASSFAGVVKEATAVEAFHKKVEEARKGLPEGVGLRIFRSGEEVREECSEVLRRALRRY
ncbi:hypothetical protein JCM8547_006382 [Rhodosporidiobolus lusitaniae]